jgi:prophage regulatory protein
MTQRSARDNRRQCVAWHPTAHPVPHDRSALRIEPLYLDKVEAAAFLAVSISTFEKLLREDAMFPRPRALSAHRNGYLLTELRNWGEGRPVADRLPPANTSHGKRGTNGATSPTAQGARSAW